MINPPLAIRLKRGKSRCHPYVADIITFYAVTFDAIASHVGVDVDPGGYAVLAGPATKADVVLPLEGYMEAAISGEPPEEVIIRLLNKEPAPEGVNAKGMEQLSSRIVAAIFSLFVDAAVDWLRHNHKKQTADWPQACNFPRVVRNAIVHGGKINIDSPTASGASWRHLRYDHRDKGRIILNTGDLADGDLIVLMLEVERELNDLGAPLDLG